MDKSQLKDVVQLAAWKKVVNGVEERAVFLSSCDLDCLEYLLEPWLAYLKHARGGPLDQHAVIVGNGIQAYVFCEHLRLRYNHRCVLDLWCYRHAQNNGRMKFGDRAYFFALVQKLLWAKEVVDNGVGAFWVDLDVVVKGNLMEYAHRWPDADFIISAEYWDKGTIFEGDALKFTGGAWVQNGGVWLAKASKGGRHMMAYWVAQSMWEAYGRSAGLDDTSMNLDQSILGYLVGSRPDVPLFHVGPNHTVVRTGKMSWDNSIVLYRMSMKVVQSRCWGPCGYESANHPYSWREGEEIPMKSLPGFEKGPDMGNTKRLYCRMAQADLDRMLAIHANCLGGVDNKRSFLSYWWNVTLDNMYPPAPPAPPPSPPQQHQRRRATKGAAQPGGVVGSVRRWLRRRAAEEEHAE